NIHSVTVEKRRVRKILLGVLPSLHLLACLAIWVTQSQTALDYLVILDLPMSAFFIPFANDIHHPLLLYAVFGTLWWFFLGLVFELIGGGMLDVIKWIFLKI